MRAPESKLREEARRYQTDPRETIQSVAKRLGLSNSGVRYHFDRLGVQRRAPNTAYPSTISPGDVPRMVRRYREGELIVDLAKVFGISASSVRRILVDAGVNVERRSRTVFDRQTEAAIISQYLTNENTTLERIGEQYGARKQVISSMLQRHGIRARRPGRRKGISPHKRGAIVVL